MSSSMKSLLLLAMIVSIVALYSKVDALPVATVDETNADVELLSEIEEVSSNLNTFRNDKRDFCRTGIRWMSKLVTNDRCNNCNTVAEECSNNNRVEKSVGRYVPRGDALRIGG